MHSSKSPSISQLTVSELESKLLAAANTLRGPIDPSDFKAYIFPLLFFKRISDNFKFEKARLLEDFSGDEELAYERDNFAFYIPDKASWEDVAYVSENTGAALLEAFDKIEEANPDKLGGIFGDAQWNNKERLPEDRLQSTLKVFDSLNLDQAHVSNDVMGGAYEYLLKHFADESGKKAGEFFTPRSVVELMATILDPQPGESIYDPTCGSGGLLVESVELVKKLGGDARTLKLHGQEINQTTAAIAKMNLFFHSIEDFDIQRGDTLRDPKHKNSDGSLKKFDMIVANPPFSLKNWGHETWAEDPYGRSSFGVPPKSYGDFAFIEHMISSLKEDSGRMAVVMPHGILFRGGEEGKIRENLLKSGWIEAIISLPENLFYNTSIPTAIIVCRAPSSMSDDRKNKILFVDGSERYQKAKNRNDLNENDIKALVDAYHSGEDPDGEDSGVAVVHISIDDIKANGYSLNVSAYIEKEKDIIPSVKEAWAAVKQTQDKLKEKEEELQKLLKEAGYSFF